MTILYGPSDLLVCDDLVVRTRIVVRAAHHGQRDKQGRDYFDAHLVPIAAAGALFGPLVEAAALAHDIDEDTKVRAERLRAAGWPDNLVDAVISVTKDYFGPEDYVGPDSLISRSAAHWLGALVKLIDNMWNTLCCDDLATTKPQKAQQMLDEKYLPARPVLLEATGLDALTVFQVEMVLREHLARLRRGEKVLFPEMTPCNCDGAAYHSDTENFTRTPFLVNADCPMHGTDFVRAALEGLIA